MSEISDLIIKGRELLDFEKLPDLAVLVIGVVVGLIGKNLYTLVKNILGVAGSFIGRMAAGYWQDIRRETPNVLDCKLAVLADVEGTRTVLMDSLIGSRSLASIYLNPRTAFGVRIQAFFVKRERPYVYFAPIKHNDRSLTARFRAWRNARRAQFGLPPLPPVDTRQIKYRRVYAPIEAMIGQYLTNEWAVQMSIGEPCYVFRFVVALVYEKHADDYVDRQFHAVLVWEEALRHMAFDGIVAYQPEYGHRAETLRRVAEAWRSDPRQFGTVFMMVPKSNLCGDYVVERVENQAGIRIPIHRPVRGEGAAGPDAVLLARLTGRHVAVPSDLAVASDAGAPAETL
ncbi:hypothetical protein C2U72_24090 [Prosthecomicrobium hirschii]|uniref:hypothetical protein n=1 Tax=Prosthecodimorpha hirschii TaxID=665126 RepID=UPI00112B44A7|nr:hypothetical protein [Prosthecomicrobium hirschii]TPQ47714.1 hypothetical protein C2U72_24090 [Prosthecomicrobium hirschii]